jgi:hypothetical protein
MRTWLRTLMLGMAVSLTVAVVPVSAQAPVQTSKPLDAVLWSTIQNTRNAALLESFIQRFPSSSHRSAAQTRLAAIGTTPTATPRTTPGSTGAQPSTGPSGTLISPGSGGPSGTVVPNPGTTPGGGQGPSGTVAPQTRPRAAAPPAEEAEPVRRRATPSSTQPEPQRTTETARQQGANCFNFNGRRFCE